MKRILILLVLYFLLVDVSYSQQINACYNKRNGALRISTKCNKTELPISWNIQGEKGDKGDEGKQGDKGDTGDQGLQGLPGVGNLGVYDGSGLFLGFLIETLSVDPGNNSAYKIFNPDISGFLMIVLTNQPVLVGFNVGGPWFISTDCSGQPYIFTCFATNYPLQGLFVNVFAYSTVRYYIYDTEILPVSGSDIKSLIAGNGSCSTQSFESSYVAYPVKQVDVPLMNTTLQYPIIVKPIQ